MENSPEEVEITPSEWRAYVARLYRTSDLGDPAAVGICMECERAPLALWIYGDFVLCARCCRRRELAKSVASANPESDAHD